MKPIMSTATEKPTSWMRCTASRKKMQEMMNHPKVIMFSIVSGVAPNIAKNGGKLMKTLTITNEEKMNDSLPSLPVMLNMLRKEERIVRTMKPQEYSILHFIGG